ncbi:unnamed protein product, partial [Prunus brigantina]
MVAKDMEYLCVCSMVECDKRQRSRSKEGQDVELRKKLKRVNTVVHCGPWSVEKIIFLYGVVMLQCNGHINEDVDIIS